ncbi:MAG: ATPase [Thermoplasmata archaeon]|nr:ATPase [Thermoplasmata archaeon]
MAVEGLAAIGAGIAIGLAALAAGIAEKDIGTAAIGAIAENPKLFGKALAIIVIPETLVIFALLIAFKILGVF